MDKKAGPSREGKWVALVRRLALLPDSLGWVRLGYWGGRRDPAAFALRKALGDQFVFSMRRGVLYARRKT